MNSKLGIDKGVSPTSNSSHDSPCPCFSIPVPHTVSSHQLPVPIAFPLERVLVITLARSNLALLTVYTILKNEKLKRQFSQIRLLHADGDSSVPLYRDLPVILFSLEPDFNLEKCPALDGADTLLLIPPRDDNFDELCIRLVKACKNSSVRFITFISFMAAGEPESIFGSEFAHVRLALETSGVPSCEIASSLFFENLLCAAKKISSEHVLLTPLNPDREMVGISQADVALSAAIILADPNKHQGKKYLLTNTERLSMEKIAKTISSVTGSVVRLVPLTFERTLKALHTKDPGPAWRSSWRAFAFVELLRKIQDKKPDMSTTHDDFMAITSLVPLSFAEWVELHKSNFMTPVETEASIIPRVRALEGTVKISTPNPLSR